jgi:hypothetical protein
MQYTLLGPVGLSFEDHITTFMALALVDKKQVMLQVMKETGYIKAKLTPCIPYTPEEMVHNSYASQLFMELSNKYILEQEEKRAQVEASQKR